MELVLVKLNTLLELVVFREASHMQPQQAPEKAHMHRPNSFCKIISQAIQLMAHLTLKLKEEPGKDSPNIHLRLSREEAAWLDAVKRDLEDMRYRLVTLYLDEKSLLPEIRADIQALLKLCPKNTDGLSGNKDVIKDGLRRDPKGHQEPKIDWAAEKAEMLLEMEKQIRNAKIGDVKLMIKTMPELLKGRQFASSSQHGQEKKYQKTGGNNTFGAIDNRNRKKKYNYLQECEKQIAKIRSNFNDPIIPLTPIKPKKDLFLQSTNHSSRKVEKDPLGDQLELALPTKEAKNIAGIEILADFDMLSDDSIQREKKLQDNLEDSLEIMKQEQGLNKTAFFGIDMKEVTGSKLEGADFSFCSDI